MHPNAVLTLKRILNREATSLLQYLRGAWPWWSASEEETAIRLQAMIGEERQGMQAVADYLGRRRIRFDLGQFPEEYTSVNFLALDHLLPRLVTQEKQAIGELERDLADLPDAEDQTVAQVVQLAQAILETKRRHLAELERLAAEHAGSKAVSTLR